MLVTIFLVFLVLLIFNFLLDQLWKSDFKEKHFPKNIIFKEKEIELPEVEIGEEIPKKIYRCYSTYQEMQKFQKVFDLTEERMKGYQQIYFDDNEVNEYIRKNFSERVYSAYCHINPEYGAARADFFRYLVIYKEGGIYMDIKTGPSDKILGFFEKNPYLLISKGVSGIPHLPKQHLKNIFNLADDWSFITNIWGGSEWQQFIIASPKGNPILKKVIQQVISNIEEGIKNKNVYSSGHISVVAMTGPITYSLVIEKYKEKYKDCVKFFSPGLEHRIQHTLVDYKKIMGDKHYSKQKNKTILV